MSGVPEKAREDRFEQEGLIFHEKIRKGYLSLARQEPDRFRVIDATGMLLPYPLRCAVISRLPERRRRLSTAPALFQPLKSLKGSAVPAAIASFSRVRRQPGPKPLQIRA
jgi:hypothetical protein